MEDPDKVKKIKDLLNKESGTTDWDDVIGIFTYPSVAQNPQFQSLRINLNQGATVKMFINTKTGELRTYLLDFLKKDNN